MTLIADILLIFAAISAAAYCYVLAARLKKFTALESGMGGAIAVLSAQVDDMTRALAAARTSAEGSSSRLEDQVRRAEDASARLEIMLAALHDLPDVETRAPISEPEAQVNGDRRVRFIRRRPERTMMRVAE